MLAVNTQADILSGGLLFCTCAQSQAALLAKALPSFSSLHERGAEKDFLYISQDQSCSNLPSYRIQLSTCYLLKYRIAGPTPEQLNQNDRCRGGTCTFNMFYNWANLGNVATSKFLSSRGSII